MTVAATATVVVELTAQGRGAVSVVLIDGPDARRAVSKYFSPVTGRMIETIPINRIALGRWGGAHGEELIFCRRAEQQVEIHCHGGAAAARAIVSDLVKEGCTSLAWTDWLRQSSDSPIRSAAHIALAEAVTERTAAILLDQLNGALEAAIREIIQDVRRANWSQAGQRIEQLLNWRELGLRLTKPWRIVVAGAPNVGKSSLINALAGYERAIVSPNPGTTRDVVTVTTAIDGWPVQLADTAGIREAQEQIESEGIKLAASAIASADLVVLLQDANRLNDARSAELATKVISSAILPGRLIHVVNKIDLLTESMLDSHAFKRDSVLVSALTRQGIDDLISTISRSLVPDAPAPGEAVPFTELQHEYLLSAKAGVAYQGAAAATTALQAILTPTCDS